MKPQDFRAQVMATILAPAALLVVLEALSTPIGTIAAILLMLIWTIGALVATVRSIMFWNRAWRQSLCVIAIVAVFVIADVVSPLFIFGDLIYIGDVVHFAVMEPWYNSEVAALPQNGFRFKEWSWGGLMLFATTSIVYDETDELSLSRGRQSASWLARRKNVFDITCGQNSVNAVIRPLWAHYNIAYVGC